MKKQKRKEKREKKIAQRQAESDAMAAELAAAAESIAFDLKGTPSLNVNMSMIPLIQLKRTRGFNPSLP